MGRSRSTRRTSRRADGSRERDRDRGGGYHGCEASRRRRHDGLSDNDASKLHGDGTAGHWGPGANEYAIAATSKSPCKDEDQHGRSASPAHRDERLAKIDSIRAILAFHPIEVATKKAGEGDAEIERTAEEILNDKTEKNMDHFKQILGVAVTQRVHERSLLDPVVSRCIDLGFTCAQAVASATGAEFRASLIGETGAQNLVALATDVRLLWRSIVLPEPWLTRWQNMRWKKSTIKSAAPLQIADASVHSRSRLQRIVDAPGLGGRVHWRNSLTKSTGGESDAKIENSSVLGRPPRRQRVVSVSLRGLRIVGWMVSLRGPCPTIQHSGKYIDNQRVTRDPTWRRNPSSSGCP